MSVLVADNLAVPILLDLHFEVRRQLGLILQDAQGTNTEDGSKCGLCHSSGKSCCTNVVKLALCSFAWAGRSVPRMQSQPTTSCDAYCAQLQIVIFTRRSRRVLTL